MWALYRKELWSLWPFLVLTFLLMSGDLLYRPWVERLDEETWESIASYIRPGESGAHAWVLAALSFFVAYSAFPREHDDKTIDFLHALPVRRPWIFVSKACAGVTILWGGVLMLLASDAVQSVWDTQSFSGGHWRADVALTHGALQLVFCAILYAHGLLASVLRLFGLLPYVLILCVAWILEDVFLPAAWIDPTQLLNVRYVGQSLSIAWLPWAAHAFVGAVALVTAYLVWMGPAAQVGQGLARARASLFGRLSLGCGTALAGVFLLVLAAAVSEVDTGRASGQTGAARPARETASLATDRRVTDRYELTYPVSHEARALALIASVDAMHAAVQEELGAERGPVLLADLTEDSTEHLGISAWTHLRVGVVGELDPARLRHTFAHETVHAFQHRLSDMRQSEAGTATRFFAEGSAEYVAYHVAPNPPAHRQARVVAAATWTRHRMRPIDLIDDRRLHARLDTTLVYSLGERWVAAMVRTCGPAAVGGALRAMNRAEAPDDLEPRAFWGDVLQAIGCDLEAVNAGFGGLMRSDAEALRVEIQRLPRIGGGVSGGDDGAVQFVAILDRDPVESLRGFARIRADTDASDTEAMVIAGRWDPADRRRLRFRISAALIPSARFQFQLCVRDDDRGWPFCERWRWGSL